HRRECLADGSNEVLLQRLHLRAKSGIAVRIFLLEALRNHPNLTIRRRDGNLRLYSGDSVEEMGAAIAGIQHPVGEDEWTPGRDAVREIELGWRDADDVVVVAIERDRLADDRRITAEARTPQVVGQHDDASCAAFVFSGTEIASDLRLHPEQVEERR